MGIIEHRMRRVFSAHWVVFSDKSDLIPGMENDLGVFPKFFMSYLA
jgi:hypothetical protein